MIVYAYFNLFLMILNFFDSYAQCTAMHKLQDTHDGRKISKIHQFKWFWYKNQIKRYSKNRFSKCSQPWNIFLMIGVRLQSHFTHIKRKKLKIDILFTLKHTNFQMYLWDFNNSKSILRIDYFRALKNEKKKFWVLKITSEFSLHKLLLN